MRKIIPVVAAGATALAVAGTTFAYAALNNDVTLAVDGQTSEVTTMTHEYLTICRPTATGPCSTGSIGTPAAE